MFRQRLARWFLAPVESVALQVPRALVASGLAAILDVGILILLVEGAGWSALPAATVGYLAGGVLQYLLCLYWIFPHSPQDVPLSIVAFTFLSLIGLGITWMTIAVVHQWGGLGYTFAKVIALGLAFVWNFASRRYWVFTKQSTAVRLPSAALSE